jgi:hypothetical protein
MKKPFTLLETCIAIIVSIPMLFMTLMWLIKWVWLLISNQLIMILRNLSKSMLKSVDELHLGMVNISR